MEPLWLTYLSKKNESDLRQCTYSGEHFADFNWEEKEGRKGEEEGGKREDEKRRRNFNSKNGDNLDIKRLQILCSIQY